MKAPLVLGIVAALGLSAALSGCADRGSGGEDIAATDAPATRARYFEPQPAPRGGLEGYVHLGDYTAADMDAVQRVDGYEAAGLGRRAVCGVSLYEMSFRTTPPGGRRASANATAAVLVPTGADRACGGAHAVVAFAQGTQTDTAARAADPNNWGTRLAAAYHAAQGFVVVIPDYLGDGTPDRFPGVAKYDYHPYLHAQSEATTILDAVRAVRSTPLSLSGKVMLTGASQGGHATAAAHLMAETIYRGELDIAGTSIAAGVLDVPRTVATWRALANDPTNPASGSGRVLLDKATAAWSRLYEGGRPLSYPNPDEVTPLARANDIVGIPGLAPPRVPLHLCGYDGDALVPFAASDALAEALGPTGALPVVHLSKDQIDRGTAKLRSLDQPGIGSHLVAATVCSVLGLDYFIARR